MSAASSTMKPLLSGPPIKRTPSIKRTLSRVPKRTSDISLYNEPLFSGHLQKPLLSGHRTELTIVVLDYVLEIRTEVS